MSAATTEALYKALRTRLLTFQALGSPTPDTLGDSLTSLWVVQGPDTAAYPYGIMRLQARQRPGEYAGEREAMDLELLLYDRPRKQQYVVEGYADIADQALLRYADSSAGLFFSGSSERDTIPMNTQVSDREVVAVRCVYHVVTWPQFLTQYSLQEA